MKQLFFKRPDVASFVRITTLAVLLLSTFGLSYAGITVKTSGVCATPTRDISIEGNAIVVRYEFPEILEICTNSGASTDTVYYALPGFGFCYDEGKPKVPMRIDTFRLPAGYKLSISSVSVNDTTVICEYAGVGEPVMDSSSSSESFNPVTPYSGLYPVSLASVFDNYELRGENIAEIAVSPIRYDYDNKTATLCERIEYRLSFTPLAPLHFDENANTTTSDNDSALSDFLSNSLVTNINDVGESEVSAIDSYDEVEYVVVTVDKYLESIKGFLQWKNMLGYATDVISKESWRDGYDVMSALRNYRITNRKVKYLLIVGDHEDVPAILCPEPIGESHYSDLYYANKTNGTFIPDIYTGRVSVNTIDEARETFDKIIRAEMCPSVESQCYENAVHCAFFQTSEPGSGSNYEKELRRFVRTSEEIRDYVRQFGIDAHRFYKTEFNSIPTFYTDGTHIPNDLKYPTFNWICSGSQIADRINSGSLYALYRGHGSKEGWSNVGFTNDCLSDLNNSDRLPIVFSITCQTGMFDEDCFAERLLKLPDAGASAVIAASQSSVSNYNDAFAEGMFDAIWPAPGLSNVIDENFAGNASATPAPTYRLGQIMHQGLFRMKEQCVSSTSWIRYQYEIYHLFGDPSMYFFTQTPVGFSNVNIERTSGGVTVSVDDDSATISFYDQTNGRFSRTEGNHASFSTTTPENTIVCIYGHNKIPYIDGIYAPAEDGSSLLPSILNYSSGGIGMASIKIFTGEISGNVEVSVCDLNGLQYSNVIVDKGISIQDIDIEFPSARGVYVICLKRDGTVVDTKKIIL